MYGQMTAGSWIYIGTQGILQGTYETLGSLARQQGWSSLKGKFVLTAGLGEMGGAQPLAVTMNEGVGLLVEVDPRRANRRLALRQVDVVSNDLEEAMTWVEEALPTGDAAIHRARRQRRRGAAGAGWRAAWSPTWSQIRRRPRRAVWLHSVRPVDRAGRRAA